MELGLLIAMKKLEEKEVAQYSFDQVFTEYDDFASKDAPAQAASKNLCLKVWDI